jgi:nicotinate-nucleotide adenylyltransferase
MTNAIGILGGTFDPVHFGHLRSGLDVAEQFDLAEIRLIPAARPPHRGQPQATAEQRLEMLELAVAENKTFVIDDRELHRQGKSYTIDTLLSLRQEFPNSPLYLILGTDAFYGLTTWHRWQELLDFTHIIVMTRPGEKTVMPTALAGWQIVDANNIDPTTLTGKVYRCDVSQLDISATQIRTLLADNKSPQFLLPEAVLSYARAEKIY